MDVAPTNVDARKRFQELRENPSEALRWDWYALLRLIQAQADHQPPIGHGIQLNHDPVRLGQPPFMHPPQTPVASLKMHGPHEAGAAAYARSEVPWINSFHFGLFGPHGALPLHLTEYAYVHIKAGDSGFASFCNVLHHRFLSFYFRAWADARKEVQMDRRRVAPPGRKPHSGTRVVQSGWEEFIGCLVGVGLDSLRTLDSLPYQAKLFYSGWLLAKTRTADGLRAILQDFFEVPAAILQFRPTTCRIPFDAQWKLGGGSMSGYLGRSTIAGETVQNYQDGFRVRIGPVNRRQLDEFLPISAGFEQLRDWIRLYLGRQTDPNDDEGVEAAWDLQIVLEGKEVPKFSLGSGVMLGWTTWLYSAQPESDVQDLVIKPGSKPPVTRFDRAGMASSAK